MKIQFTIRKCFEEQGTKHVNMTDGKVIKTQTITSLIILQNAVLLHFNDKQLSRHQILINILLLEPGRTFNIFKDLAKYEFKRIE